MMLHHTSLFKFKINKNKNKNTEKEKKRKTKFIVHNSDNIKILNIYTWEQKSIELVKVQ